MGTVDEQLGRLLGVDPPASILALDEVTRADLVGVIESARARQARELAAAYESSLKHVPLPIRGIVKKVLGA